MLSVSCNKYFLTMSDVTELLKSLGADMKKAMEHVEKELLRLRAGKASPALIEHIKVDYYGTPTPLSQVGSITVSDARTLTVQPWEKTLLPAIEKAIQEANLGLNPQNDGDVIRINIPMLTEERRKDLVKKAKSIGEDGKITVRNIRKEANNQLKKMVKDGLAEDEKKSAEENVQDSTNSFVKKIDGLVGKKEDEIMTV